MTRHGQRWTAWRDGSGCKIYPTSIQTDKPANAQANIASRMVSTVRRRDSSDVSMRNSRAIKNSGKATLPRDEDASHDVRPDEPHVVLSRFGHHQNHDGEEEHQDVDGDEPRSRCGLSVAPEGDDKVREAVYVRATLAPGANERGDGDRPVYGAEHFA
jgi:hypothetical protein